jgi:hypothetical protein
VAATAFSLVFSLGFMADDDLGEELEDADSGDSNPTAPDASAKGGRR